MPPEMTSRNIEARDGRPLSSKTNVWGIGNIIGSMMWYQEGAEEEWMNPEGYDGLTYDSGPQEPVV